MAERGGPTRLSDAMKDLIKDQGWGGNLADNGTSNADPNG